MSLMNTPECMNGGFVDDYDVVKAQIAALEAQLAAVTAERDRMRAALEWYADDANWSAWMLESVPCSFVECDHGNRARAALKGDP